MLGEAASRALRNSTPDPSFGGGRSFFCADTAAAEGKGRGGRPRMGWGEKPGRQRERERERERETMRSREWEQAGEAEPGVAKNRVTLPCKRLNPVRQCPLEPHSRPHSDRSLLPPLQPQPTTTPYTAPPPTSTPHRRGAIPSAHRPTANSHPTPPRGQLPLACTAP